VMYVMPAKEWRSMLNYVRAVVESPEVPVPPELQQLSQKCRTLMEDANDDSQFDVLRNIRIVSPIDFTDALLGIRQRLGQENFEQWFTAATYDAPKLVDSIMRMRALGSIVPVLRFDIDVLFNEYTKADKMSSIKASCSKAVTEWHASLENPSVQSYILSQQYSGLPAAQKGEFTAWNEGFSTRANPALLATPAMVNASQWSSNCKWGSYVPSSDTLQKSTVAEVMMKFYGLIEVTQDGLLQAVKPSSVGDESERLEVDVLSLGNTYLGANPTTAVVSGAGLVTSAGVTLDVPPFIHTELNIMWVDDHCLDRFIKEVMGTKRQTDRVYAPHTPPARVVKARPVPANPAKYTLEVYMPTLTYGIILDKWINSAPTSYLLKYDSKDLDADLEDALETLKAANSEPQGPFTLAYQKVRHSGKALSQTEKAKLTDDLWNDALYRLQDTYYQWNHLPVPPVDGVRTPTFAALWVTGRVCKHPGLERYCTSECEALGAGLVLPAWDAKASGARTRAALPPLLKSDLQPAIAAKIDTLIGSAFAHLEWLLRWPSVVQAVRSDTLGSLPSDPSWGESTRSRWSALGGV